MRLSVGASLPQTDRSFVLGALQERDGTQRGDSDSFALSLWVTVGVFLLASHAPLFVVLIDFTLNLNLYKRNCHFKVIFVVVRQDK